MNRKELRQKWEELHRCPEKRSSLRAEIRDSWERSSDYQINPYLRENPYICTEAELKQRREASSFLIETSRPVMDGLLEYVAGSGFVIGLSDPNLCWLDVIGDSEALRWAKDARAVSGALWLEELVGTNSGSMSLLLAKPYYLYGYEHFCLFSHVVSSFSTPIIDEGRLVGGLGLVAPYDKGGGSHTLGMVVAAAMHIKSKMQKKKVEDLYEVIIDSMNEGLFSLDSNLVINLMNENCFKIFHIGNNQPVVGKSIYDLLGNNPDNQYFINQITQGRSFTDENFSLRIGKQVVPCSVTCTPLKNVNSQGGGVVIIIRERHRINKLVQNNIGGGATVTFKDIVAKDVNFSKILKTAQTAAAVTSNVLLLGESGTGKDMVAQAMHNASSRNNNPYLAINCAALPRELIASELFGYEDGAFTGARKGGNLGKFEIADQGTIFLDEIGDMPLDIQASLLRFLEDKKVMRLGGDKFVSVNVRIIAATNKDLEAEIERNRFRRDLFYRLGVIKIAIPPLRERPEDILELSRSITEKICQRFNMPALKIDPDVVEAFRAYKWPGNVREMQNVIEGAVLLATEKSITGELISIVAPAIMDIQPGCVNSASRAVLEKQRILDCLAECKYKKSATAIALGVSRTTLYRRLKELNIEI
ncbi:MAG: sigma 54-interacting transcriptional regulator [Syntrophomonadaceae bacterium]|nr:sigma 54-interacting transcriptional regulator [Syntrophomonadaceae bacterium]